MAKYGTINVGDVVKYTDKAKIEIASAIREDAKRYHIVEATENNGQTTKFEDGGECDTFWLKVVAMVAKI